MRLGGARTKETTERSGRHAERRDIRRRARNVAPTGGTAGRSAHLRVTRGADSASGVGGFSMEAAAISETTNRSFPTLDRGRSLVYSMLTVMSSPTRFAASR